MATGEAPSKFHIETVSGLFVIPWNLDPELVRIEDISFALSNVGRFTGHVKTTVAAHSVLVSHVLREMGACGREQYAGLMHDAHEAYLGDVNGPTCKQPEMAAFCAAKDRAQVAILKALPGPGACRDDCDCCLPDGMQKKVDSASCMVEAYYNLPSRAESWPRVVYGDTLIDLKRCIISMTRESRVALRLVDGTMSRAESGVWFMKEYERLTKEED